MMNCNMCWEQGVELHNATALEILGQRHYCDNSWPESQQHDHAATITNEIGFCLAVNVAVFINGYRVDEAPQLNSNFMAMTNLEIEESVRGCLWQIVEMLSTDETESVGFDDSFDALCDGLVARGSIEGLLDYTEARLDEVAKLLQGEEWGEWVAPHLSEARPRTRTSARHQVKKRAATCFNVCAEMMDLSRAFNE